MEKQLLQEVLGCLCGERTLYYYHADQYAVYLLRRLLSKQPKMAIRELRNSRWSSLLKRPLLKSLVAECGNGYLEEGILDNVWPEQAEPFVMTLGRWGGVRTQAWSQTSRPGTNLVLQLNLSTKWCREFEKAVKLSANRFFDCGHPLSDTRATTLAWARLDIDFGTDEVLVEEIQSDLVRGIVNMYRLAQRAKAKGLATFCYRRHELETTLIIAFAVEFLAAFAKNWQEIMLSATLDFVFDELGISLLYYHSFETGNQLKHLHWSKPPRSLYTDLPKRFCFTQTNDAPIFLQQERTLRRKFKKMEKNQWFYMAA